MIDEYIEASAVNNAFDKAMPFLNQYFAELKLNENNDFCNNIKNYAISLVAEFYSQKLTAIKPSTLAASAIYVSANKEDRLFYISSLAYKLGLRADTLKNTVEMLEEII